MHPDFTPVDHYVDENFPRQIPAQINTPYAKLVETFGPPNAIGDTSKSDATWCLRSPAGEVCIWNYKNGPAYTGHGRVEDIGQFSMRGENREAVNAALAATGQPTI